MTRFAVAQQLLADEVGADATEYALPAALIAVALILGATFLGSRINTLFNGVGNKLPATIP